jgi:hypothetical protein
MDGKVEFSKLAIQKEKTDAEIKIKQDEQAQKDSQDVMPKFVQALEKVTDTFKESMIEVAKSIGGEREAVLKRDEKGNLIGASSRLKVVK